MSSTVVATKRRSEGKVHWSYLLMSNTPYRALSGFLNRNLKLASILMVVLPVAWLVLWNIFPLGQMLNISLLQQYPVPAGQSEVRTFEHYLLLFTDYTVYLPFLRTMGFAVVVSFVALVLMTPLAYFIAKKVPKNWQVRLLLLAMVPSWVGELIRVFSYVLIFASNGAINLVLMWANFIERPIPFLYTWFSLGAGMLYVVALFMLVPLYAAIEKIPSNVLEAASDLGANGITRFFKVTLPLMRDGIATGVTLVFLITTGVYTVPMILAGTDSNLFAQVIASYFHESSLTWPRGAALAIILFVSALIISGVLHSLLRAKKKY
ncbi:MULTISPECIES: ABC transporter permease [unclassified Devosia]|uniref:ABC transporter permease n=1 Tax=unclassified Devosia TaxID=196773 RepID=UPI00145E136D|nr:MULTISPECIES: ABC transporter permease [unclassified Devosia]MBJ6988034.1 ABC transporter permease [Devosia sp. MC521]QMW62105.1 ABC transporter permease [Devosia sp. MC521]